MPLTQVSPGLLDSNAQYYGFKNRIINGAMVIAQRGTAAVTGSGEFPVDRFLVGNTTDGAFSAQQDSSAPAGFINSVKLTTTTADATLTTTQNLNSQHRIEGTNVADLGWGTANAKTVTLSFWVRSSLTGTFGGALKNSAENRSYPFTYSISVADTWEYKTITITGDTSGTWLTTNGIGIIISFGLGAGPDRSGTAGAWNSNNNASATSAVSVIGTLSATWYVTGVQLEVGSVATSFDFRSIGTELALCQRYYEEVWCQWATIWAAGMNNYNTGYRVTKRAAPTFVCFADTTPYAKTGATGNVRNTTGSANVAINSVTSDGNLNGFAIDYSTPAGTAMNMRATVTSSAEL